MRLHSRLCRVVMATPGAKGWLVAQQERSWGADDGDMEVARCVCPRCMVSRVGKTLEARNMTSSEASPSWPDIEM